MRVALVHYWLLSMRGGEKVLEQLCELFPNADIFTHLYAPDRISDTIRRHRVRTTFIQRIPGAIRYHRRLLPLMPLALEQLDLRGYDLVISSESGPAKGVLTAPGTMHLCYCHSPMRYLWDMYHEHLSYSGTVTRWIMRPLSHYLRLWDAHSAQRVDAFAANSHFVAKRVKKYYRRNATIIYPPIDTQAFYHGASTDDSYLMVGQLTRYKKVDLAVEAFNASGRKLIIIGEGEEFGRLRSLAKQNVILSGHQPFEVIRDHYARCRALLFPGVEDFGIVPVEAMASGLPIIAYRGGGIVETMVEGETGVFFDRQSPEALNEAVDAFERCELQFSPANIAKHAKRFDQANFRRAITNWIERMVNGGRTQGRTQFPRARNGPAFQTMGRPGTEETNRR